MTALGSTGSTRAWRRLRPLVFARDGRLCQIPLSGGLAPLPGSWAYLAGCAAVCGAVATHVDHVTPRAVGGTDDPENLRAACARHNLQLGARQQLPAPDTQRRRRSWPTRWEW